MMEGSLGMKHFFRFFAAAACTVLLLALCACTPDGTSSPVSSSATEGVSSESAAQSIPAPESASGEGAQALSLLPADAANIQPDAVPEFLTADQQELYRAAYYLYYHLMYPVDLLLIRSMKTLPLLSEIPDGATIKIPGLPIIPPFAQHWIACLRQTLPTVLLTNIKTISRAMTACFISALATGAAIFSTKAANFHGSARRRMKSASSSSAIMTRRGRAAPPAAAPTPRPARLSW